MRIYLRKKPLKGSEATGSMKIILQIEKKLTKFHHKQTEIREIVFLPSTTLQLPLISVPFKLMLGINRITRISEFLATVKSQQDKDDTCTT